MSFREFLPSTQFVRILASLFVSVGLIAGAEYYVGPKIAAGGNLGVANTALPGSDAALLAQSAIDSPSTSFSDQTQALINGAETNNLTETIGRALLINGSAAVGQGLQSDPTAQQQIVDSALAQVQDAANTPDIYNASAITAVPDSSKALHEWANSVAEISASYPNLTYRNTLLLVTLAVDNQSSSTLVKLPMVAKEYESIGKQIASLKTPETFVPATVAVANLYDRTGKAAYEMQFVLSDPTRGLLGIQEYNTFFTQSGTLFTQIAQALQNSGILFTNGEPGSAWSLIASYAASSATQ